jgi:hypothetical protein
MTAKSRRRAYLNLAAVRDCEEAKEGEKAVRDAGSDEEDEEDSKGFDIVALY